MHLFMNSMTFQYSTQYSFLVECFVHRAGDGDENIGTVITTLAAPDMTPLSL